MSQFDIAALELQTGHRYLLRVEDRISLEAMEHLFAELKMTAPGVGFLIVDGRVTPECVDGEVAERCRKAVNELDVSVLARATEGKPDAEEVIVWAVLEALFNV